MTIRVKLNQTAVLRAIARRNMSQNMLAIRAGISSGYISQIMCGTRNPSPRMRQKLQDCSPAINFRRHIHHRGKRKEWQLDKREEGSRHGPHDAAAYRRRMTGETYRYRQGEKSLS